MTHEASLPDARCEVWEPAEDARAFTKRRLARWRARGGVLAGDVNYAHLPRAARYLADPSVKVVALRRDREKTIASYEAWTAPGGAEGSVADRDHWRPHAGDFFQVDEWDLTFPKYPDAPSKTDAIGSYYDEYYGAVDALSARYPGRVLLLDSPALFDDAVCGRAGPSFALRFKRTVLLFAMRFKRTASAFQRCKNERRRRSYASERRVDARRFSPILGLRTLARQGSSRGRGPEAAAAAPPAPAARGRTGNFDV